MWWIAITSCRIYPADSAFCCALRILVMMKLDSEQNTIRVSGIAQLLLSLLSSWTTYIRPSKPARKTYKVEQRTLLSSICKTRYFILLSVNGLGKFIAQNCVRLELSENILSQETLPALMKNPLLEYTAMKRALFSW